MTVKMENENEDDAFIELLYKFKSDDHKKSLIGYLSSSTENMNKYHFYYSCSNQTGNYLNQNDFFYNIFDSLTVKKERFFCCC